MNTYRSVKSAVVGFVRLRTDPGERARAQTARRPWSGSVREGRVLGVINPLGEGCGVEMRARANSVPLPLATAGPAAADGFRFARRTARLGAACWIEWRGAWRAGVIVWRGHAAAVVALGDRASRARYVRRAYQDLRRRVIRPALKLLAGRRQESAGAEVMR